ncbi:hypothetical protein [Sporomusa paucivorans]|uniref:hypothetical protein n=1 Tax=Sporomusa paucivorans TaxID=2376 RepID=UPI003570EBC7
MLEQNILYLTVENTKVKEILECGLIPPVKLSNDFEDIMVTDGEEYTVLRIDASEFSLVNDTKDTDVYICKDFISPDKITIELKYNVVFKA